jgi:hypothetical protein
LVGKKIALQVSVGNDKCLDLKNQVICLRHVLSGKFFSLKSIDEEKKFSEKLISQGN